MAQVIQAQVFSNPSIVDPSWRSGPVLIGTRFYVARSQYWWENSTNRKERAAIFFHGDSQAKIEAEWFRKTISKGLQKEEYVVVSIVDN